MPVFELPPLLLLLPLSEPDAMATFANWASPLRVALLPLAKYQLTRCLPDGTASTHHFCPACGCEMWYVARPFRETMAIPIGRFAEPGFPAPQYSVYEARKHAWVAIAGEATEHYD